MFARFLGSLLIEFVVSILKPSISESLHDFMAFSFCSWFFPGILLPQLPGKCSKFLDSNLHFKSYHPAILECFQKKWGIPKMDGEK